MPRYQEVEVNFIEMTPSQYGKQFGIGESAVRRRCEQGHIDAYKTDGGHWKIKVPKHDTISKEAYEQLKKENAELKAKLSSIFKIVTP